MSTERTPLVTDEQIKSLAKQYTAADHATLIGHRSQSFKAGAYELRSIYEAELSRKDAEIEALRNPWISVKDRLPNKGTRRIAYLYNPNWAPFRDGHEPHRASSCTADNLIYDVLTRKDGTEPFASHWCELPTPPQP